MEAGFEQVSNAGGDLTDQKQATTARTSGVVGRILELKKRRQQLSGILRTITNYNAVFVIRSFNCCMFSF